MKANQIHTIVCHKSAHVDERYATYLMKHYGEELLPGCLGARVAYWGEMPKTRDAKQLEDAGYVLIGMGCGRFDEHLSPGSDSERLDDECAAGLIATHLYLQHHSVVKEMIKRLTAEDQNGGSSSFELPLLTKRLNAICGDVIAGEWVEKVFDAIHGRGVPFFEGIGPEAGKRWDKLVATWMVTKYCERDFPGISTHGLAMLTNGIPEEVFAKLGISERTEGECLSMALAKPLYLDEDIVMGPLLGFTVKRQERVCGEILELHAFADALYETGCSTGYIWMWAKTILDMIYDWGIKFTEQSGNDFKDATIIDAIISRGYGKTDKVKLVVGKSDSESFAPYARSKKLGCGAGIVIQQNSVGNQQIFTNGKENIDLTEVMQIIRIEEWRAEGRPMPDDYELLGVEGEMPGCPKWYFFKRGKAGLNGTLTKRKPPTAIPLARTTELVQIGLDTSRFEPSRAEGCRKGYCSDTDRNPCPWFPYQLKRCWNIQRRTLQQRQRRENNRVEQAV